MAGVERPRYKPNVAANKKAVRSERLIIDIPEGSTMRFRLLPKDPLMLNEIDEGIYYVAYNHFKVKNEEGNNTALACLCEHGNEEVGKKCYLCELSEYLMAFPDKSPEKTAGIKMRKAPQFYVQVFVAEKDPTTGIWSYTGPRLLRIPVTGSRAINRIMANQERDDEISFLDISEGFDLNITHNPKEYTVDRVSKRESLDDLIPDWEDKFIKDMGAKLSQIVVTREEQREAAIRMWGNTVDFEKLAEAGF